MAQKWAYRSLSFIASMTGGGRQAVSHFSVFSLVVVALATVFLTVGCDRKKSDSGAIVNSIGMSMVEIPAGRFQMGSVEDSTQMPIHEVTIVKSFLMSATVVTQKQWEDVMETTPWIGENLNSVQIEPNRPAVNMSHGDAVEFCRRLSNLEGKNYRLPSEAEWEYSARAGSKGLWFFGDSSELLAQYAWFHDNSWALNYIGAHPVAMLKPNPFGLYDLYGNIWELCADNWHADYHGAPVDGSAWIQGKGESDHVMRGGSHRSLPLRANSTIRYNIVPIAAYENVGFRVACDINK
ncbi:MAG: formylglycine-generating enzyme family protein [Holophagaceae bacterium]|nr:formylglycine-generating enzyme family protein [Holophagaceae bacterium]